MLKHIGSRLASCDILTGGILRDALTQLLDRRGGLGSSRLKVLRQLGIGRLPSNKHLAPCIVLGLQLTLVPFEELARFFADVEPLLRQTKILAGGILMLHASLAMCGVGALHL